MKLFSRHIHITRQQLKQLSELPTHVHNALIGMVLSDAGLYKTGGVNSNCRLEFSFGRAREAFALHIESIFAMFCSTTLATVMTVPKLGSLPVLSYRLKTIALPVFTSYHSLFYVIDVTGKYKKVIPANVHL